MTGAERMTSDQWAHRGGVDPGQRNGGGNGADPAALEQETARLTAACAPAVSGNKKRRQSAMSSLATEPARGPLDEAGRQVGGGGMPAHLVLAVRCGHAI
jgi:hypothetical protein